MHFAHRFRIESFAALGLVRLQAARAGFSGLSNQARQKLRDELVADVRGEE